MVIKYKMFSTGQQDVKWLKKPYDWRKKKIIAGKRFRNG